MPNTLIGQVIDEYRLDAELGVGGMGVVYKAQDTSLDRTVALKMLKQEFTQDALFMQRFRTEARSLARIHDPAIVTVFALRNSKDHTYIAMEYVEGRTFKDIIKEDGPMPASEAVPIFVQLLEALGRAHRAGVIHRDIKPANLMLSTDGQVKIMDFGLARLQSSELEMTKTSHSGGTPYYMPPEQFEGLKYVDNRSDLYALGMTLYQCLTGRLPMSATTMIALMREVAKGNYTPPHLINPAIPLPLSEVIMKALEGDPQDRFSSAEEMAQALSLTREEPTAQVPRHEALGSTPDEIVVEKTVLEDAVTPQRTPKKETTKRGFSSALLSIALVALLGAAGWLGYPYLLAAFEQGPSVEHPVDQPDNPATEDPSEQLQTTPPTNPPPVEENPNGTAIPPPTQHEEDPVIRDDPPPQQSNNTSTTPVTNPPEDPGTTESTETETPPAPVTATLKTNGFALVNGERQGNGRSMQTLTVPADQNVTVECRRSGLSSRRTVSLAAGATQNLRCVYEYKINIGIQDDSRNNRGTVLVDGQEASRYKYPISVGVHEIDVQKANYELAAADLNGRRISAQNGKVRLEFAPSFSDESQPDRLLLLLQKQN